MTDSPLKKYGYTIHEELDINLLHTRYASHRRMKVFILKGLKCVHPECTRVGTRLIIGKEKKGNLHTDLYTDDYHMMTIDHIIPKSKGGGNEIDNLQPMCHEHNHKKGNDYVPG